MTRHSEPEWVNRSNRFIEGKNLSAEQIVFALTGEYPKKQTFTEYALNSFAFAGDLISNRVSRIRRALIHCML